MPPRASTAGPRPRAQTSRPRDATRRRRVLVIHGPNLNLLGAREPEIYGTSTLAQIDAELVRQAERAGVELRAVQSNVEGDIVGLVQKARGEFDAIIINPAAYTHTSIAIRDALDAVNLPAVEVHLSNLHRREAFRRRSLTAAACVGQVSGFGAASYYVALDAVIRLLDHQGRTS